MDTPEGPSPGYPTDDVRSRKVFPQGIRQMTCRPGKFFLRGIRQMGRPPGWFLSGDAVDCVRSRKVLPTGDVVDIRFFEMEEGMEL